MESKQANKDGSHSSLPITHHASVAVIEAASEVHTIMQLRENCILYGSRHDSHMRTYDIAKRGSGISLSSGKGAKAALVTRAGVLLVADEKNRIEVWDTSYKSITEKLHTAAPDIVCLTELWDGRVAAIGSDRSIYMCDPHAKKLLFRWAAPDAITCAVHLDNGLLATGHDNGDIRLWDMTNMSVSTVLERGDKSAVRCMVQLFDGRVASSYDNGVIALWDPFHRRILSKFAFSDAPVLCLLYLHDGRLISGDARGMVSIWDAAHLRHLESFKGHEGPVNGLIELMDGKIASGGSDKRIRLWDVASTCSGPDRIWGLLSRMREMMTYPISSSSTAKLPYWDTTGREELIGLTGLTNRILASVYSLDASRWSVDIIRSLATMTDAALKTVLKWFTVGICREIRLKGRFMEMGIVYKFLVDMIKNVIEFAEIVSFQLRCGDCEQLRPFIDLALKLEAAKSGS